MSTEAKDTSCSRCGGATEEGTMRDTMGMVPTVQNWMDGTGKRVLGLPLVPAQEIQVKALRCRTCGHLDLYANR